VIVTRIIGTQTLEQMRVYARRTRTNVAGDSLESLRRDWRRPIASCWEVIGRRFAFLWPTSRERSFSSDRTADRSPRSPVPEEEWETIVVADVYERYGKRFGFRSVEAVYRAIKDGRFPGHQIGHRWYVIMPASERA
jgi:hypothetical protein